MDSCCFQATQKFCYSSPDITQQRCDVDATMLFNKLKYSVAPVLEASLTRRGRVRGLPRYFSFLPVQCPNSPPPQNQIQGRRAKQHCKNNGQIYLSTVSVDLSIYLNLNNTPCSKHRCLDFTVRHSSLAGFLLDPREQNFPPK